MHLIPVMPVEKPLVLLIDDNITQLDLYAIALHPQFETLTATHAKPGFELAERTLPQAIVVDALLPDEDGLALATRLAHSPTTAHIPIIVLTGDDASYARAQENCSDWTGVLHKPCRGDKLVASIQAAIERTKPAS